MAKKAAKVYQYKIDWVEIPPEEKKILFKTELPYREYIAMSVASGYSSEYFRRLFLEKPDKLNRPVYEAIVGHFDKGKVAAPGVEVKDLNEQSTGTVKEVKSSSKKTNYTVNTLKDRAAGIRNIKNKK